MNITSQKPRIIFFSSSDFGLPTLRLLVERGFVPILCITKPNRLIGRQQKEVENIIAQEAFKLSIPVIKPKTLRDQATLDHISQLKPNLGILVSYGKVLPDELLHIPTHGILNIHPSLLPLYRGPSPIQTAILNGDTKTGTTIMLLDQQIDHGPIVCQEEYSIKPNETSSELFTRLGNQGAELLVNCLMDFISGALIPKEQDHSKATFTKIILAEDGHLDSSFTTQEAWNRFRALRDEPGCFIRIINLKNLHIKILECRPDFAMHNLAPGTLYSQGKKLFFSFSDGALQLISLQKAGGKVISANDFINGNQNSITTLP